MSQHDFEISNSLFPTFRNDLNQALGALASNNLGLTPPPAFIPGMLWVDNSTNKLKILNTAGNAWWDIGSNISENNLGLALKDIVSMGSNDNGSWIKFKPAAAIWGVQFGTKLVTLPAGSNPEAAVPYPIIWNTWLTTIVNNGDISGGNQLPLGTRFASSFNSDFIVRAAVASLTNTTAVRVNWVSWGVFGS